MPDVSALDMLPGVADKPAMSATSDFPSIKNPQAEASGDAKSSVDNAEIQVSNDDQAAPGKGKTPENSASSDEAGDDTAAHTEGHKPPKGVQKRIDELTRQREDAKRLADEQSKRLDQALEMIKRLTPSQDSPGQVESGDARPVREQFEDPDSYTEAVAEWSAQQAVKKFQADREAETQKAKVQEAFQEVTQRWVNGREKAAEKYADYAEVAENPEIQLAQHVGFAIVAHENGHDIAYYLGKHPEEASRLSQLSPLQSALEIGRLGERLSKVTPEVSKAPPPVKPIGARNEASPKSPNEESMEEYAARRQAELRRKR